MEVVFSKIDFRVPSTVFIIFNNSVTDELAVHHLLLFLPERSPKGSANILAPIMRTSENVKSHSNSSLPGMHTSM